MKHSEMTWILRDKGSLVQHAHRHKKGTKARLPIFTVLEISNSISRDPGITSKSCSAKLTL